MALYSWSFARVSIESQVCCLHPKHLTLQIYKCFKVETGERPLHVLLTWVCTLFQKTCNTLCLKIMAVNTLTIYPCGKWMYLWHALKAPWKKLEADSPVEYNHKKYHEVKGRHIQHQENPNSPNVARPHTLVTYFFFALGILAIVTFCGTVFFFCFIWPLPPLKHKVTWLIKLCHNSSKKKAYKILFL